MSKMIRCPLAFRPTLACLLALALAPAVQARNISHMLPVAVPLAQARASDGVADIDFAFGSASARGAEVVGGVASVQGIGLPPLKPHGGEPIDDEVCQNALRDALQRLAQAARKAGGHAVVGIVGTYNGITIDDPAQVECRMGESRAVMPLSGVIVKSLPAAAAAK